MAFEFYSNFCKCATRKRNIRRKKTKKLSQFLKSHISGTREAISLKFGMWSAAVGRHVHSKNRLVSSRKHRATEVRKLRFLSSCQYTHGCYAPASWAARHTTVCLDVQKFYCKCTLICSYCSLNLKYIDQTCTSYYSFLNYTKRKLRKILMKNIGPTLKVHISLMAGKIELKFGKENSLPQGIFHRNNAYFLFKHYPATDT